MHFAGGLSCDLGSLNSERGSNVETMTFTISESQRSSISSRGTQRGPRWASTSAVGCELAERTLGQILQPNSSKQSEHTRKLQITKESTPKTLHRIPPNSTEFHRTHRIPPNSTEFHRIRFGNFGSFLGPKHPQNYQKNAPPNSTEFHRIPPNSTEFHRIGKKQIDIKRRNPPPLVPKPEKSPVRAFFGPKIREKPCKGHISAVLRHEKEESSTFGLKIRGNPRKGHISAFGTSLNLTRSALDTFVSHAWSLQANNIWPRFHAFISLPVYTFFCVDTTVLQQNNFPRLTVFQSMTALTI